MVAKCIKSFVASALHRSCTLRFVLTAVITFLGFLLGMVLAGVGGLSAKTVSFPFSISSQSSDENKKIEKYWKETGLSFEEVRLLISNQECHSSLRHYEACLNAVAENALAYGKKLSVESGQVVNLKENDHLEEKNERELLAAYSDLDVRVDFEEALNVIQASEANPEKIPVLAASLINSFLSVYADPHTYIMPGNFYSEVGSKLERSKFFIGLSYEKKRGEYYIRRVSKNSDADMSGLKEGDKVISINSQPLKGMRMQDVAEILRREQTDVFNIEVARDSKIKELKLQRTYRQLSHVQYETVQAYGDNYGLIRFTKFNTGACAEVARSIQKAREDRVKGIILDMRDNPGGQLDEAACIAGLFLGRDKKAYYVEYFDASKSNEVALTSEMQLFKGPMITLINRYSASSAELLAGGLQDYRRSLLIGERTFGKGTFQESEEWALNGRVSLFKTQGLYLLPSRNSTQLVGITPDVEIKSSDKSGREEDIYYSPHSFGVAIYSGLRESEKMPGFIYRDCGAAASADILNEDAYLAEGLRYLKCSKASESNLAQREVPSVVN